MVSYYEEKAPKGEFVLVIEGKTEEDTSDKMTLEEAVAMAKALVDEGMKLSAAAKEIAKKTDFSKSEIYNALI